MADSRWAPDEPAESGDSSLEPRSEYRLDGLDRSHTPDQLTTSKEATPKQSHRHVTITGHNRTADFALRQRANTASQILARSSLSAAASASSSGRIAPPVPDVRYEGAPVPILLPPARAPLRPISSSTTIFTAPPPPPPTTTSSTATTPTVKHLLPPLSRPPPSEYLPCPPLQGPDDAPPVPVAPPSGMYWSRAPVSGYPHSSFRAHTTTLIGSNVYVFGGCDSKTCFNSMYVLDADAFYWSVPLMVGDVPTPLRAMTCTAVGRKLVVFGGGDGPTYYNDVYVLDTVNFRWSRPRIVGDRVPSKRRAHTACLYKNGIYVFGGGDGVKALNDIWRLDVGDTTKMSWRLISSAATDKQQPSQTSHQTSQGSSLKERRPKARGYHTANMVGSKLIIYGGSDGGECFDDVWIYDMDKHVWKPVPIALTFRRLSHTATIVGSYLFVIGGHDGNEYCNDVLLLNLVTMTWDKRRAYGVAPRGRGYHGTVLYDSRLLVIGGFDGSEVFGDVVVLELAVHAYYSQISHFTIDV